MALDPAKAQAWSAIAVACLTGVLVVVTTAYVILTRSLVKAAQTIELDVVVLGFNWVGHPDADDPLHDKLGPFPEILRITNRASPIRVKTVHYDATRAGGRRVGGMVGDAEFVDPQESPALIYRGGVLYCGFGSGVWALEDDQQEVAVDVTFRRSKLSRREIYTARAGLHVVDRPWGDTD